MRLKDVSSALLAVWGVLWLVVSTAVLGGTVILGALLRVGQDTLQFFARLWARLLYMAVGMRVKVSGRDNLTLGDTYIFAVNHTSMLDILVLLAKLPKNFRWIAKKELFKIPFFGWSLKAAGYIPIDRSDRRAAFESIELASRRVTQGASVVIFPEGTRTPEGQLGTFKSGGFILALKSGRPVVPVALVGSGRALAKGSLLLRPGLIELRIGQPLPTQDLSLDQRQALCDQTRAEVAKLMGLDPAAAPAAQDGAA